MSQEGQALDAGAVGDWIRIKVGKDKEMQAQVLRPGAATSALIGASRVEQIEENVRAVDAALFSEEELRRIDEIVA